MSHERIARVVLGLAAALALAILGAHPRVKALERRFGVTVLLSTGLPFLLIGALFRLESVGILTADVLGDLRPAFEFGLGWIGFVVGIRFDVRRLDKLPRALGPVIALASLLPMATTAVLCTAAFVAADQSAFWRTGFVRDALVLAACAAPSAALAADFLAERLGARGAALVEQVTVVDDVVGLVVLGVVACLFRPDQAATRWVLPPSAWLLVSLGLGGVLGILTFVLLRNVRTAAEELALLLGAVALSAGMAGYLALSAPVVCAIAGALLANLPLADATGFQRILADVERPLFLFFLIVVGAAWRPGEWQGWLLAPVFVLARVAGKQLGAVAATRVPLDDLPPRRALGLALLPQSPISIVIIVAAATLYAGDGVARIRWGLNAVIIGGILTELVGRLLQRRTPVAAAALAPASAPIDVENPPPPVEEAK